MRTANTHQAALGCLLGTAVGDSVGLPGEGLSRRRVRKFYQQGVHHRFLFGHGMLSDDTEHTLMVAAALCRHPSDAAQFQKSLGWSLRWWMLALPAGVGLSTAKAIIRLWLGFPASRAGVRSAGNGAAMRSAIIGVFFADEDSKRREFALTACRLTHTDARAEESAILVSEAAALASKQASTLEVLTVLKSLIKSEEMRFRWEQLEACLEHHLSVSEYASKIGCERGVSGFAPNTVAVALFAWLRHRGNFETIISEVILCGGDTDSVAAIAGAIAGTEVGEAGIPKAWIDGICDWPRSVGHVRATAAALAGSEAPSVEAKFPWFMIPLRNVIFLLVVLMHGFRRILPPY